MNKEELIKILPKKLKIQDINKTTLDDYLKENYKTKYTKYSILVDLVECRNNTIDECIEVITKYLNTKK